MDTVNFLGISIVGQSNKGGDGGIYVGSIMKGLVYTHIRARAYVCMCVHINIFFGLRTLAYVFLSVFALRFLFRCIDNFGKKIHVSIKLLHKYET